MYMGRGTQGLLPMWIPLGDTSLGMGCLALVPGSHNQQAFTRFQVTQDLSFILRFPLLRPRMGSAT